VPDKLPIIMRGSGFRDFGERESQIQKTGNLCCDYLAGSEGFQIQPWFGISAR
jgi:hypothetical protein